VRKQKSNRTAQMNKCAFLMSTTSFSVFVTLTSLPARIGHSAPLIRFIVDRQATNVKHLSPKTVRCRAQAQTFAQRRKSFAFALFTVCSDAINPHLDYAVTAYPINIPPQCSELRPFFEKRERAFFDFLSEIDNTAKLRASRDLSGDETDIRPLPRPLVKRKLCRVRRPLHLACVPPGPRIGAKIIAADFAQDSLLNKIHNVIAQVFFAG